MAFFKVTFRPSPKTNLKIVTWPKSFSRALVRSELHLAQSYFACIAQGDFVFPSTMLQHPKETLLWAQVDALGKKLRTDLEAGLSENNEALKQRQETFGSNTFPEKPSRGFWVSRHLWTYFGLF